MSGGKRGKMGGGERTFVTHVMNLVENDPSNLTHDLGTAVKHRSENLVRRSSSVRVSRRRNGKAHLGSHDKARSGGVDRNISRHQSDVSELREHFTVLLVGKGLREERGRSVQLSKLGKKEEKRTLIGLV